MEKYGEIPKRFTKAWWEYFWEYYKWYVIVGAVAIVMTLITVNQCVNQVKYDFTLTFAGKAAVTDDNIQPLADRLSEVIEDSDGNGEKNVLIQNLAVISGAGDGEYEMAMAQKLMLEFATGDGSLFIFSRDKVNEYLNDEDCNEMFVPVADWAEEMPDADRLCSSGGVAYAVELSGSKVLSELDLNAEGCYLMLRVQRDDEKEDPKSELMRKSATAVANLLLEQ